MKGVIMELTYKEWYTASEKLNTQVDEFEAKQQDALSKASGGVKPQGGLYSDEVQADKDVIESTKQFRAIFRLLQAFNKQTPKGYMRRRSQEHRARRMAKNK